MSSSGASLKWAELADQDSQTRITEMTSRMRELASKSDEERRAEVKDLLREEAQLAGDKLSSFTRAKARSLAMLRVEEAQKLAASFHEESKRMDPDIWQQEVQFIQESFDVFSRPQQDNLRQVFPDILGSVKTGSPGEPQEAQQKKPWWAFWKKE